MAYYDSFTKKPQSKRDDWRDDEMTRRPARDEGRAAPTERRYGEKKNYGERREYGERRSYGERREDRPQGERPAFGGPRPERRTYEERDERREDRRGMRPQRDDRYPREERHSREERRPHDERRAPAPQTHEEEMENNLLVGRNPIREALRAGRDIEKLLVARGELIGSAREIVAMAKDAKIIVQEVDRVRLDQMAPNHQGLIAVASAYGYKTVDDMLALAKERGEAPLLVILDGVTDPHNLGAIIRSAECAGAHGVIIPERRAVGLTPAAVKASAGAVEYLPVAREVNLTRIF